MSYLMTAKINGKLVYHDAYGNVLEKTKAEYPYNYSPITQYKKSLSVNDRREKHTVYSDRLLQLDYEKHNLLCEKHFGNRGQYWDRRNRKDIEAFLRDWTDNQNLVLTQIIEYCNESDGYPYWRFDYVE